MRTIKVACVQIDCDLGNPDANRRKIEDKLRAAADLSAGLAIFPECALTGYCFDSLQEAAAFAEPLTGRSATAIAEICNQTNLHAVIGFIEQDRTGLYNAAMIVGPNGPIASYRKVHLPFLGVDRFLTPGDRLFEPLDLPFGKIGVNICYDLNFPEAARTLKLLGAELIVLPTNWPTAAWRTPQFVVNTRAQENHVNVAAVNRVGVERGWSFIGRSKIVDFNGDEVATAGGAAEEIVTAEIDLESANHNRVINNPGVYEIDRIADRRPEFYRLISQTAKRSQSAD